MTGCAGDLRDRCQGFADLFDDLLFHFVKRPEHGRVHIGQIVFHLGQAAHAGQHHGNTFLGSRKADGPRRRAGFWICGLEDRLDGFRRIGQGAALDRLHDNDRLAVFPADFQAFPGSDIRVLPVGVIDLQLDEFNIRVLVQQFFQHGRHIME